nr:hypothetical protein BaRGS_010165 [Batillaria attramentaria]
MPIFPEPQNGPFSLDPKKAKHIMEKRRRARINASLAELKCLLPGGGRQGTCSIKMEKADILERAVEHLKLLTARCCSEDDQIQSLCGKFHDPRDTILENYDKGYRECLDDVDSYLLRMHIDDPELREQILEYVEDDVVEIDMEDISDDGKCFNESSEVKNEDNNNNNNFASVEVFH